MKKFLIGSGIAIFVAVFYLFGFGLQKNASIFIADYSLSADGTEMTVQVSSTSSVGFVRDFSYSLNEDGILEVGFYSAFGGINGSWGAKSTYVIPLKEKCVAIALYKNIGDYRIVLEKDENGNWNRVK